MDGNVPHSTSYGIYISQLIRFARVSGHVVDFNARNKSLTAKRLQQGYRDHKLRKTFSKFYRRHYELVSKFNVGLKTLLHQGLSEPEFYGDLVYKFKKIVGRADRVVQMCRLIGAFVCSHMTLGSGQTARMCGQVIYLVCYTYIAPANSSYTVRHNLDILSLLEYDISHYSFLDEIMICGDTNARTGIETDYVDNNRYISVPHYTACNDNI